MGFTGAANAVIRWDVYPSPTEVIHSGRSEVLGSVTLVVQPNQTVPIVTGNSLGGPTQIGIIYNNGMMIDNSNNATGIRVYTNNTGFATTPITFTVANIDVTGTGTYAGLLTLNIPGNVTMNVGDVIRVDGVRGRVVLSTLATPGNDGFAQMQSVNDPAGNQFFPETIRVAKSFIPMLVTVASDTATLCLPPYGRANGATLLNQSITVKENFVRAFVAKDSNGVGPDSTDRLDSTRQILGSPTNGTELRIILNGIPASVASVQWQAAVATTVGGVYRLITGSTSFTAGTAGGPANGNAAAVYEYFTSDQAGTSDITMETYVFQPALVISATNQQDVGKVRAGVSLYPGPASGEPSSGLYQPYLSSSATNVAPSPAMPRFNINYLSNDVSDPSPTGTIATTQFGIYEIFSQCVCYLLYPYTTKDSFWDTGMVVANTSEDAGAIPTAQGAARQAGTVTFWLYDFRLGNITPAAGVFFADTAHTAPLGQSGPAFDAANQPIYYAGQSVRGLVSQLVTGAVATTLTGKGFTDFAGYVIAKANFQYCHGYAFIADRTFANIAQGYVANMIPDPAVKGGTRKAADAADITNLPAGEGINN